MILCDAITLFIDHYTKSATRESFKYPLRTLQDYVGAKRPLESITMVDLERWNIAINKRNIAVSSKDNYRRAIKTFFNYYVKMKELDESPAKHLKFERRKEVIPKGKAMPDEKLSKLITYLKFKKSKRDLALVCFLADSGARIGEATSLLVEKIEWDHNRAWISGKTGGRYVPFFEEAARWLKEWLMQRKGNNIYAFSKSAGNKMQVNLDQEFRRACIAAGIGSWGPHSLRHRKGWQYSDSNINPAIAQRQFGHSDVKITIDFYYPQDWDRVEEASKKLSLPSSQEEETKVIRPEFRKAD